MKKLFDCRRRFTSGTDPFSVAAVGLFGRFIWPIERWIANQTVVLLFHFLCRLFGNVFGRLDGAISDALALALGDNVTLLGHAPPFQRLQRFSLGAALRGQPMVDDGTAEWVL